MVNTMVRAAAIAMLFLAANWQPADAKCKRVRRDYEVNVWPKGGLPPGTTGLPLLGDKDKDLGCVLEGKPLGDDASLCAGADTQSHFFGISVVNHCEQPITAVVRIVNDADYPIVFKKSGKNCKDARDPQGEGKKDVIKKDGDSLDVVCKTDKYARDPNQENPRAKYFVTVLKVGLDDVKKNGGFDPEIVVDRSGEGARTLHDLASFDLKFVFLVLVIAAMGMLASLKLGHVLGRSSRSTLSKS